MLGDSFTIWVKQTFASYRQGQHQNYSLENRLCHAAVTGEGYPMFNDFGHEEHKTTGRELNREDKMTSNYQVAKFLANERVNEQLGSAKHYRLAKSAHEGQGNKRILNIISPALAEASQRMTVISSYLVSTFGVWATQ